MCAQRCITTKSNLSPKSQLDLTYFKGYDWDFIISFTEPKETISSPLSLVVTNTPPVSLQTQEEETTAIGISLLPALQPPLLPTSISTSQLYYLPRHLHNPLLETSLCLFPLSLSALIHMGLRFGFEKHGSVLYLDTNAQRNAHYRGNCNENSRSTRFVVSRLQLEMLINNQ